LNVTEKNIAVKINVSGYFELILRPFIFIQPGVRPVGGRTKIAITAIRLCEDSGEKAN
jgi:hypothetical protein